MDRSLASIPTGTGADGSSTVAQLRSSVASTREFLKAGFSIDTRTLAVFRILAGLLAAADVLLRSRNFHFFYTEAGVLPVELARAWSRDSAVSVFYYVTDPAVIALLFAIHFVVALQLVVGYKTRVAVVITFLFVVSLDNRAPIITSYADVLFRLLLFWALFLPLGERWSIDAVHRDRAPRGSFFGVASIGILLQMVAMYFINGIHKARGQGWIDGGAAPLVLAREEITFLIGDYLYHLPYMLVQMGGFGWFYILTLSPLLFFLRGWRRAAFAFMLIGGHASFALTARIGAFAYVGMAGAFLFVPAAFWVDGATLLRSVGGVRRRRDRAVTTLRRTALQVPNVRVLPELQARTNGPVYDFLLFTIVISLVLVFALSGLQMGGYVDDDAEHDQRIVTTAEGLLIDQPEWSIFAPNPGTSDRYHVFAARTADGDVIDIYNDRELVHDRPYDGHLQRQYGTYRERFYMNTIRSTSHDGTRNNVIEYHCAAWEAEHGQQITDVSIYSVRISVTNETYDAHGDREKTTSHIYDYNCAGEEPETVPSPEERADSDG